MPDKQVSEGFLVKNEAAAATNDQEAVKPAVDATSETAILQESKAPPLQPSVQHASLSEASLRSNNQQGASTAGPSSLRKSLPRCTCLSGTSAVVANSVETTVQVRNASRAGFVDAPGTPMSLDTPSPSSAGPSPRRRRERQRSKPENHTPRPPNAWILYRSAQIQRLKADAVVSKKPQAEISKLIGFMWRDESNATKLYYEDLAAVKKAEHQRLYPDYAFKPQRRGTSAVSTNRPPAPRRLTAPSAVGWRPTDPDRSNAAFPSCLLSPEALHYSSESVSPATVSDPSEIIVADDTTTPLRDDLEEDIQTLMKVLDDQHLPSGLAAPFDIDADLFVPQQAFGNCWPPPDASVAPVRVSEPSRHYITPYSAPAAVTRFSFAPVCDPLAYEAAMPVQCSLGLDFGTPGATGSSESTASSSLSSVAGDDESCISSATSLASPAPHEYHRLCAEPCSRCEHSAAEDVIMPDFVTFDPATLVHDGFSPASTMYWPASAPATGSSAFLLDDLKVTQLHEYEHSLDAPGKTFSATPPHYDQDSPFMFPFAIV
ncbi:hypothetical protein OIV83_002215 [Microbotryomycetes sp. JL201]|nr:hypothetical protein OIV83_002215 [Microbotryomycetes sp. JL201]